jgi:hypothetical protein
MSCAETALAVQNLEKTVKGMLPDAESRVAALEKLVRDRMAEINSGFGLVDTLWDASATPIKLEPRFASYQNAVDFEFSAAEDYAPENCFVDLRRKIPGIVGKNYLSTISPYANDSYQSSKQLTGVVSLYANIAVGTRHGGQEDPANLGKYGAQTRIALLANSIGSHHQLVTTGNPTPNYREPRYFLNDAKYRSLNLHGQNWGTTNFNDLFALAENVAMPRIFGNTYIRLINLGNQPIWIKGAWFVYHGEVK